MAPAKCLSFKALTWTLLILEEVTQCFPWLGLCSPPRLLAVPSGGGEAGVGGRVPCSLSPPGFFSHAPSLPGQGEPSLLLWGNPPFSFAGMGVFLF